MLGLEWFGLTTLSCFKAHIAFLEKELNQFLVPKDEKSALNPAMHALST
jgi:hypothetical protein